MTAFAEVDAPRRLESVRRVQLGGRIAMLAGAIGTVDALLLNAAYNRTDAAPGTGSEGLLFDVAPGIFTFAPPADVYATYGKVLFFVFLGILPGILALHHRSLESRRATGEPGSGDPVGLRLAIAGVLLNLFGNVGDYWVGEGAAFEAAAFLAGTLGGMLLLAIGLGRLGLSSGRAALSDSRKGPGESSGRSWDFPPLPRFLAWAFVLWLPAGLATAAVGVGNLPAGPILALGLLWVVAGPFIDRAYLRAPERGQGSSTRTH